MWYPNGNLVSQARSSQDRSSQSQDRSSHDRSSQDWSNQDWSSQDWSRLDWSCQDWSNPDRSSQSTGLVMSGLVKSGKVKSGKRETDLVDHCGYDKPELFFSWLRPKCTWKMEFDTGVEPNLFRHFFVENPDTGREKSFCNSGQTHRKHLQADNTNVKT